MTPSNRGDLKERRIKERWTPWGKVLPWEKRERVTNSVSLLQTQRSHREGHEAGCIGLEAMLLTNGISFLQTTQGV